MNYTFMPSLGHMALVVIAVSLWNQNNALTFILSYYLHRRCYIGDDKWQLMEGEISKKIPHLPLPDILKEYLMGCIRPVGRQILKWLDTCNESGIKVERFLIDELCWTSSGTINTKKTAACLIKKENLDICKRYELACVYCLENDIPKLWDEIPLGRSKGYFSKYVRVYIPNKLALLWAYDIKGELDRLVGPIATNWKYIGEHRSLLSPYQFAFEYSVVKGNRAGTEYFLQKMTPTERKVSLVSVTTERAVFKDHSDILCFLLSQMDEEQLIQVYSEFPQFALNCLLEWPSQKVFIGMARNVWNFISPHSYEFVLGKIIQKVSDGYKDYDYQTLLEIFWKESPATHKRFMLDRCAYGNLFTDLSRIKDVKFAALIMRHAIVEVRDGRIFVPRRYGLGSSLP